MKLSRTVTYAVRATLQLGRSEVGVPVPCSQLATEGHMPERFLLQVLRQLVTHGILHSTRGVDGGYALNRPADEISLLEVIEAIDGPLSAVVPSFDGADGLASTHKLQAALEQVATSSRKQLQAVKLSDLLAPLPVGRNGAGAVHLTAASLLPTAGGSRRLLGMPPRCRYAHWHAERRACATIGIGPKCGSRGRAVDAAIFPA